MKKSSIRTIIFGLLTASLIGCTADGATVKTLRASGFTNIETRGYDWFACSKGDWFSTKFTAKNPNGIKVRGTVCCGVLKSCTVRF